VCHEDNILKTILNIVAVMMAIAGTIFILQGLNILTGSSFMTGDPQWSVIGTILVVIGVGWLVYSNRRRTPTV